MFSLPEYHLVFLWYTRFMGSKFMTQTSPQKNDIWNSEETIYISLHITSSICKPARTELIACVLTPKLCCKCIQDIS